ncbi:glycosyltransferase family 2 protein [Larkinella sp. VNQ87]|uniref:glycosyltransferase family 2 protein n=1 Tax=Larkinella sp. VNQ87 TaxID=3400921 RepID=UPI003C0CA373
MELAYSIAVVIPTYNRKNLLQLLLDQLGRQETGPFSLEIVVIVDGSTDGTLDLLCERYPTVHVVVGSGNWWFTKSVNEGIRYVRHHLTSSHILIMNDDSYVDPDYLRKLVAAHQRGGEGGILGSLSVTYEQPARITFGGTRQTIRWSMQTINYLEPFEPYEPGRYSGLHPTECLNGRGTLVPVPVFDRIGLLDERRFPQYGSDDDLALTAKAAGVPVLISWDAVVYDRVSLTAAGTAYLKPPFAIFIKSFFNLYSINSIHKTIHFYRKHGLPVLWPLSVGLFVVATFRAYLWKYRRLNTAQ